MPRKRKLGRVIFFLGFFIVIALFAGFYFMKKGGSILTPSSVGVGVAVDSLDGVVVYYNGHVHETHGRNLSKDGYNIGLKYQCVEFVKRYYFEHYNHKMPDSYGHAKDFYDKNLQDGEKSSRRALTQYSNPSSSKPCKGDLLVFDKTSSNPYGHVAIISDVKDQEIEVIQQNPGPYSDSRIHMKLVYENDKWKIDNSRIMGWLRK